MWVPFNLESCTPKSHWEDTMKKFTTALAAVATVAFGTISYAADLTVGVSWSNFQEERWKTDEAAIKSALEAAGAKYVSADAQSSSSKQLSDVESLIAQGVNAIIILAQDSAAIGPAVQAAAATPPAAARTGATMVAATTPDAAVNMFLLTERIRGRRAAMRKSSRSTTTLRARRNKDGPCRRRGGGDSRRAPSAYHSILYYVTLYYRNTLCYIIL